MCKITKIVVLCNNEDEFYENYTDSPYRNEIEIVITNLIPYQNYFCVGIVQNSKGNSSKSNETYFKTKPDGIPVN